MAKIIMIPPFWTVIDKFEDIKFPAYYQLHIETTPRSPLIDTRKNFRSIPAAERYYRKQLKTVLEDVLIRLSR